MPKLANTLTDRVVRSIEFPPAADDGSVVQLVYWCPSTPGFGVRVSSGGSKVFYSSRRVNGKVVNRNLGKASGSGAISVDTARKQLTEINNELLMGVDRKVTERAERKAAIQEAFTFGQALKEYVQKKRRGKDGLPLKERTKTDYLKTIEPGDIAKDGKPFRNGSLFVLADEPLAAITAQQLHAVDAANRKHGKRGADMAMQVLRAVLNWHGVIIENSPFSRSTAGRDRIVIAGKRGTPKPIPLRQLGAWWNAASDMAAHGRMEVSRVGADGLRLMLLTGMRPGEVFGSAWQSGLYVKDVNLKAGMMTSFDTKNRTDLDVMMSRQALNILKDHCKDKLPGAKVFAVLDPGKTMQAINQAAGVTGITPHKLRHTFSSIAESLVSATLLKRMLNHISGEGVTGGYIGKDEQQLATGWQVVADFIEKAADEAQQQAEEDAILEAAKAITAARTIQKKSRSA